jgi:hypothetical protein
MKNIIFYMLLLASFLGNCKEEKDEKFLLLGTLAVAIQTTNPSVADPKTAVPEWKGTVQWTNKQDFASETLYLELERENLAL